jgi:hypothetical protein
MSPIVIGFAFAAVVFFILLLYKDSQQVKEALAPDADKTDTHIMRTDDGRKFIYYQYITMCNMLVSSGYAVDTISLEENGLELGVKDDGSLFNIKPFGSSSGYSHEQLISIIKFLEEEETELWEGSLNNDTNHEDINVLNKNRVRWCIKQVVVQELPDYRKYVDYVFGE